MVTSFMLSGSYVKSSLFYREKQSLVMGIFEGWIKVLGGNAWPVSSALMWNGL
jgi:hypothetical protein